MTRTWWQGYRPPVTIRTQPWKLWLSFGHRAQVQVSLILNRWSWWWPAPRTSRRWVLWLGPLFVYVSR